MSSLVTGVAGFIGSHLAEKLVREGHHVVGIDSFTDYYPRGLKMANLSNLIGHKRFRLVEGDLNSANLSRFLESTEYVFHLAAQPGVRPSWGKSFGDYVRANIMAAQRLLEACKGAGIKRFVYASSSSVYGEAEQLPTPEDATPMPVSPYGATKLAAEHLCRLYARNYGIPAVTLRYFTVYGPRQRPDMAFTRFIERISSGQKVEVYGDGNQARDFTYVDDTVSGTYLARKAEPGSLYNLGSGRTLTLNETITLLESAIGKRAKVIYRKKAEGDARNTAADISKARKELRYNPMTPIEKGLKKQVEWQTGT